MTETVLLGPHRFERHADWGCLGSGAPPGDAAAVAVDSFDRLFVLTRALDPVVVIAQDGSTMASWGRGMFGRPHGLFIDADDRVYCVDDEGQRVRVFSPEGRHLRDISGPDQSALTGYVRGFPHTIVRAAPPFCYPTGAASGRGGASLFVTDGYGNARVHEFGPDGALRASWGEPGSGPGEFVTPHGVFRDSRHRLLVCDRENERVQVFDDDGHQTGVWSDINCPNNLVEDTDGHYFVAELGRRVQGQGAGARAVSDALHPRLTIRDGDGRLLGEWTPDQTEADFFYAPHGIAIDSRGDLYVGEVVASYGQGLAPPGKPVLTKFVRID